MKFTLTPPFKPHLRFVSLLYVTHHAKNTCLLRLSNYFLFHKSSPQLTRRCSRLNSFMECFQSNPNLLIPAFLQDRSRNLQKYHEYDIVCRIFYCSRIWHINCKLLTLQRKIVYWKPLFGFLLLKLDYISYLQNTI